MSILTSRQTKRRRSEFDDAFQQTRGALWGVGLFSFAINLLMLTSPVYMLQIYDRVLVTGRMETLVLLTILAGAALVVMGILDGLRSVILSRVGCWLNEELSPPLLRSGVRARLAGDMSGTQPLRDLAQVQGFISSPSLPVIFDAPWTPLFLLLLWALHASLGLFAVVCAVILFGLGLLNEAVTRRDAQTASSSQIVALQHADAAIRNAEVVRAMSMLPNLTDRWRLSNDAYLAASRHSGERSAFILATIKALRLFVQSAMLGLGAYLVLQGDVTGGAMIASSILLGRALAPVEYIIGSWRNLGATRLAYRRLSDRFQNIPPEAPRIRQPDAVGYVALQRVSYVAPGGQQVLTNLNLEFSPGECVAIVGPSAGGKSTLCRLLCGVLAPTDGVVRLDGASLQHWNAEQLGEAMGYLPQDVELFPGTVRDNIARMGAADDNDVIAAATAAHAHDMIQRLPQGYETSIGDGGAKLSSGQRQRLGLARALFGRPKLIVLDEPNANLDQLGEAALAAAIKGLKEAGATLVIVGHRPSTLAQADKVLFLRDGKVELFGPRDDVLGRLRIASRDGQQVDAPRPIEASGETPSETEAAPDLIGPRRLLEQSTQTTQTRTDEPAKGNGHASA